MLSLLRTLLLLALATGLIAADPKASPTTGNFNIPLWEDGKVPLAKGDGPLDKPFLTVSLPKGKRNGASMVVAPGGGNIMLMYGVEGIDIAERFNDWGAAAFILTYRLSPRYNDEARILDANRAVQIIRARAKEWGLGTNKIGFGGFSAGSSLARLIGATAKPGDPSASDPIAQVSSRPDYLVLVYGPGRATPGEDLKSFPPTFLICAAYDRGNANGSAKLFTDLNTAGAVAELHIYQKGRHGFGGAFGSPEFSPWMPALRHFLIQGGFLPEAK